jgi:ABC-2 type transport system permease protein
VSWRVVAGKDVRDAVRSRAALVATAVLVLTFALVAYGAGALARFRSAVPTEGAGPAGGAPGAGAAGSAPTATTADLVGAVAGSPGWFLGAVVALVGLVLSNEAIAGERATGSIKILLGLPHGRGDVVAGKLVGRAAVVAAAVAVATVAAGAVVALTYDAVDLVALLGLGAATVLLGVSYVGVGVGISAVVASTSRATAAATGFFLVAVFGWDSGLVPRAVLYLVTGEILPVTSPRWYDYLALASPGKAHGALLDAADPLAARPLFALAVLVGWTVLPPALGYLRFRDADLT